MAGPAGPDRAELPTAVEALPPSGQAAVAGRSRGAGGDPALLWRAAGRLGISADAAAAARPAGCW